MVIRSKILLIAKPKLNDENENTLYNVFAQFNFIKISSEDDKINCI